MATLCTFVFHESSVIKLVLLLGLENSQLSYREAEISVAVTAYALVAYAHINALWPSTI